MAETVAEILTYVGLILFGMLIWAALAPFETLGWWAGWFGDTIYGDGRGDNVGDAPGTARQRRHAHPIEDPVCYIVFLSGIARVSGETFSFREQDFLRRLAQAMPNAVIVRDIFPYSVNNMPLTGQPFFASLWRFALRSKLNGPGIAGYLINLRNIWQILISADKRYGPIFNQSMAHVIAHALLRRGYNMDRPLPLFIIGYSGAGQVSVGATMYLKEFIDAPIYVLSLGGVFASDPGVMAAERVYHIYGSRDWVHKYGLFAPGRWSIFPTSAWNRAKQEGRVILINAGPMGHMGAGGYLDANSRLPGGCSFIDATVSTMRNIIQTELKAQDRENQIAKRADTIHLETEPHNTKTHIDGAEAKRSTVN